MVDEALAEAATQCVDELTPEAGAAARCNTVLSDGEGLLVGEYIEGNGDCGRLANQLSRCAGFPFDRRVVVPIVGDDVLGRQWMSFWEHHEAQFEHVD
jgi:hypothetical protein